MSFLAKDTKFADTNRRTGKDLRVDHSLLFGEDSYTSQSVPARVAPPLQQRSSNKQQACANPDCSKRWKNSWKHRYRPIFEGHWGCSTRCLQAVIDNALRRERSDPYAVVDQGMQEREHRHRVPLGLVMLSHGWITQAQLRRALTAQRSHGEGRIGDWLVRECGLHSEQITRGLALQWSCPALPPSSFAPDAMALTVPQRLIEEFEFLPHRVAASRILYLAFTNRPNASVAFALEQMSGLRVESGLLDDQYFLSSRRRIFQSAFVSTKLESFAENRDLSAKIAAALEQKQPIASRLVRVYHLYWLRMWLEAGSYSGVGTLPGCREDVADVIFTFSSGIRNK